MPYPYSHDWCHDNQTAGNGIGQYRQQHGMSFLAFHLKRWKDFSKVREGKGIFQCQGGQTAAIQMPAFCLLDERAYIILHSLGITEWRYPLDKHTLRCTCFV